MSFPRAILDTLASHLAGLKEEGGRLVEVGDAWARLRAAPLPAPAPVAPVAPPSRPETLPPPRKEAPAAPAILWQALRPLAGGPAAALPDRSLLLVAAAEEFGGEAGVTLRNMLKAIGFELDGQAAPLARGDEAKGQAALALCLGELAFQTIFPVGMGLNMSRGNWLNTRAGRCMATFAPSYLVGYPAGKKTAWADLQLVLRELGLAPPPPKA
jgi:hypothetical protein